MAFPVANGNNGIMEHRSPKITSIQCGNRSCALSALVLLVVHGFASPAWTQPPNAPPARPFETLIEDLDNPRFETRMVATRQLVAAGGAAIDPVAQALHRGQPSLELQTRGLRILESIARTDDPMVGIRAEQALRSLAVVEIGGLARRAAGSLYKLQLHYCEIAAKKLSDAGAVVETSPVVNRQGPPLSIYRLTLGSEWKGDAEIFAEVQRFEEISLIHFDHPDINNDYLKPLGNLDTIVSLEIKRANIDDAGIAMLSELERVVRIEIYHTPISDASVEALSNFKAHTYLLYGTKITAAGKADLIRRAPAARVDVRRGGFLGIGGGDRDPVNVPGEEPKSVGFTVAEVEPNSAAEAAGIRPNDVILSYDGKAVGSFLEIKDMIAENAVGDTVEVILMRNEKKKTVKVTLREWP